MLSLSTISLNINDTTPTTFPLKYTVAITDTTRSDTQHIGGNAKENEKETQKENPEILLIFVVRRVAHCCVSFSTTQALIWYTGRVEAH